MFPRLRRLHGFRLHHPSFLDPETRPGFVPRVRLSRFRPAKKRIGLLRRHGLAEKEAPDFGACSSPISGAIFAKAAPFMQLAHRVQVFGFVRDQSIHPEQGENLLPGRLEV
jgi:hypothetical protein